MTKVVIIGDMTLGESFAPPGFPGSPGNLPAPQPPGVYPPGGVVSPPIVLPPSQPGAPDQGLPPIPGVPGLPPIGLPPGEVWPPLPPGTPEPHKAIAIVAIPGVGYRYTVVELKAPAHPDQGLPGGRPGRPARPDQGLPDEPSTEHPDQGLPPHREPKR
jgi:hypothetical protein